MNKRVLIIENNKDLLDLFGFILLDLFIEIIKSQETLSLPEIELLKPDVILLDYLHGGIVSSDLCLKIKMNPETMFIPVIIVSVHVNIGQIAKDNCADGYVAKPFDIHELSAMVETYLQ
jgi:CheY-like chemotaxis protein